MGKYRKRFNEKARSGMLKKQNELRAIRNKQFNVKEKDSIVDAEFLEQEDANAEVLLPLTKEEKEERKRKLQASIYTENESSKISGKKKKRLDKYIEHQIKREEKKELLDKLAQTKMDTEYFMPSKLLGTGRQTRKEQMIEALDLERQNRGNGWTREILYEERVVNDLQEQSPQNVNTLEERTTDTLCLEAIESPHETEKKGAFIDNRPEKFGGNGSGFTFSNLPKLDRKRPKKYNWRLRIEKSRHNDIGSDENDFESSEGDSDSQDEQEPQYSQGIEERSSNDDGDNMSLPQDSNSDDDNEENDEHDANELSEEDNSHYEDSLYGESEEEPYEDTPKLIKGKPKHSEAAIDFKKWAETQIRVMEGRDRDIILPELTDDLKKEYSKPRIHEEDFDRLSDAENYIPIDNNLKREAFYVDVNRSSDIQKKRIDLPVFNEEHTIMEAIYHHDCVIICGETGSGKTTQVPQFLYEAGFGNPMAKNTPGMIGITQPRRVAAVSIAKRVATELGEEHGKRVGYQIRFDTNIIASANGEIAMKYMTDGILLREMMSDFLLTKYSAIIIDEAHERNINTDILIGMLSRLLKLRRKFHEKDKDRYKPLKLVIMSATLRVSDFAQNEALFKVPPPVLTIKARQYPVSVHFNKKTQFNYIDEAFKKICKIHKKLPPGGILVFLTGQQEIKTLVGKLRKEFPFKKKMRDYDQIDATIVPDQNILAEVEDIDLGVDDGAYISSDNEALSETSDDSLEEEGFEEQYQRTDTEVGPLHVLPLFSLLPTNEQMKVFDTPPQGSRLCVVATNVAETSLTIPGIRYVVDCGRAKERKYNEDNGIQLYEIDWISKASADQRSGRAGRTGPGHCYRLYSSAIYENHFEQFSKPEILRMPVESVVLSMKSMGIDKILNFPFPTKPDRSALEKAQRLLGYLGALDKGNGKITTLGKKMALLPLSPRFAKILVIGNQYGCLVYIIAIVSALSVGDPLLTENDLGIQLYEPQADEDNDKKDLFQDKEQVKKLRSSYFKVVAKFSRLDHFSDVFKLLSAVCSIDYIPPPNRDDFMRRNFLKPKIMNEISKLRKQIARIIMINELQSGEINDQNSMKVGVPNEKQVMAIKQMIAAGFIDQVAIRSDSIDPEMKVSSKTRIANYPFLPLFPHCSNNEVSSHVYIHPGSVITTSGFEPPQFLIYQSLTKGNQRGDKLPKVRMKPLVDIKGKMLTNIARDTSLITFSKPLGFPYGPQNISQTKRECYVIPRMGSNIGTGGMGWVMPATKVIQIKKEGQWVTI